MRVLIVEDEPQLTLALERALEAAGFAVDTAYDGENGWYLGDTESYDAVVLDLGLPKIDGITVLGRWREAGRAMPVMVLTARARWAEKAQAFNAGADDYVTKPFGRQELLARCGALLRRAKAAERGGSARPGQLAEIYDDGLVHIDPQRAEVRIAEQQVSLTPLEFRLLHTLVRNKGQVLSRDQLLDLVWGDTSTVAGDQVKLYVGYVRRKLATALPAGQADPIETVRGFGYRYTPAGESDGEAP